MLDRRDRRPSAHALSAPRIYEPLEPRQLLAGDGRPTAALVEPAAVATWGSTYTFRVAYTDDLAVNPATLDSGDVRVVGPNGYNRNAKFYRSSVSAGGRTAYGFYKLSAPGGVWDASDNGGYSVFLNPAQVRDQHGNAARAVKVGWFTVNVPLYPTDVASRMALKGVVGVDVTGFGAIPDDGLDDTSAIQRAIDSLPKDGDGVPDAASVIGGTVVLPRGTFNTDRALKLPPAVRVRGQGAATVIANRSADADSGAFELVSDTEHGFNIRAGVEGLTLTTVAAKGIRARDLSGDLQTLRLADLTISAGGAAIDLRDVRAYATDIRNVTVRNPGSTALWIGPPDDGWISNVNRVTGLHVTGTARPGFRAERAMVVLGGDVAVDGLTIDETGAAVMPLYARGAPTFTRTDIRGGQSLPDGVVAQFEQCMDLVLDRVAIGPGRRLDLRNVAQASVGDVTLTGGTLMESVALDGASSLTVNVLRSSGDAGRLSDPRVTVVAQAAPLADAPRRAGFAEVKRPASQTVRDVTQFGAVPDDGLDDTAAIQRAIDALPAGTTGVPGVGEAYTGGLVLLPGGRFDTSAPLLVPSGVWLRGRGNGTVIHNRSDDAGRAAVELVTRHANGANVGAAVEDLSIYTTAGAGIRADGNVTAGLVDVRLSGLMIGAQSVAIDLGAVRTYHASIGNIVVSNAGSSGLILGDAAGYSADNYVVGFMFLGGARAGFRADEALIVLRGETYFQNGWVEHPVAPALPLHVEGKATIRGFWLEYAAEQLPDGVAVRLVNTTRVDIDRLAHISHVQRLELTNAKDVRVGMLNISGHTVTLPESVVVDERSTLDVGLVLALRDSGMLDHPRVRVGAAYNSMDRALIHNRAPAGPNLIADPLFTTIGGGGGGGVGSGREDDADGWGIRWGDDLGAVTGSAAVEQGPAGPRLRVTITSNPNNRYVTLRAALNVPANLVGTNAVARWRIDGPALALMYNAGYDNQYSARAMGSLTASRTPVALRAGEDLVFTLPAVGTYYISNLSVTPM